MEEEIQVGFTAKEMQFMYELLHDITADMRDDQVIDMSALTMLESIRDRFSY